MTSTVEIHRSIRDLPEKAWASLCPPDFPFWDHSFLKALEDGGAVGEGAGWIPRYLVVRRGSRLLGALCLFEKSHSYGEYIFDWEWARAHQSHRVPYYPKLVAAVPFTPATGRRLLLAPAAGPDTGRRLLEAALDLARERKASSLHALFLAPEEVAAFEAAGLMSRHTFQFHWRNRGYPDFEAFLGALRPRKAKQIRREREAVARSGLRITLKTGRELTEADARLMAACYRGTTDKMGGIAYLPDGFFREVFSSFAAHTILAVAERGDCPVAAALFFRKGDKLYGRHWGCLKEERYLHFELCYYRGIEYAIREKVRVFEAGAQGEHKVARGFLPEITHSAHWIAHPAFREAIGRFLAEEKEALRRGLEAFSPHDPYRT